MVSSPLSSKITWDFTVTQQREVARYGRAGTTYFKQYLPAGIVDDKRHPPKPIRKEVYAFALRRWQFDNRDI